MNSNMPRARTGVNVNLPLHFKAPRSSGIHQTPDLVPAEIGDEHFSIELE